MQGGHGTGTGMRGLSSEESGTREQGQDREEPFLGPRSHSVEATDPPGSERLGGLVQPECLVNDRRESPGATGPDLGVGRPLQRSRKRRYLESAPRGCRPRKGVVPREEACCAALSDGTPVLSPGLGAVSLAPRALSPSLTPHLASPRT